MSDKCRYCWGVGKRSRVVITTHGRVTEHRICRMCGGTGSADPNGAVRRILSESNHG